MPSKIRTRTFLALLALAGPALNALASAQDNPEKQASAARFDLLASEQVGSLDRAELIAGSGTVIRMNWIAPDAQARSYTCSFRVLHFAWLDCAIRFTPVRSGTVELTLIGPYEQSPAGPIYRQDVLWDAVSAENAVLANGSFESVNEGVPEHWVRPYGDGVAEAGPVEPLDGSRYARTWQNGPLSQKFAVTAGQPVTLRFHARLPSPDGDMKPLAGTDTPAHRARGNFMRGVNLSNCLEAPAGGDWGATYSAGDFRSIREEGFDHVRIPVRWSEHTGPAPEYLIEEDFAKKVDVLLDAAESQNLSAIVNVHHFDEFTADPAGSTAKLLEIWQQIAKRYAGRPASVAFELLNEPCDAATTERLVPIYGETIRRIRVSNPARTLFVGPGNFNGIAELPSLRLPEDDPNLIVTVHSYAPFLFTHQGASWTMPATATTGIRFPGPPLSPIAPMPPSEERPWVADWIQQYNSVALPYNPSSKFAFENDLKIARLWSDHYGRPVHVGEFGCIDTVDPDSRARYYRAMRETLDRLGIGWAIWDWKAKFRYWDSERRQPVTDMREALFGSSPRSSNENNRAAPSRRAEEFEADFADLLLGFKDMPCR